MPVILVVDDSEMDRVLIRELLGQEDMDWLVEFAESAEQAIVMLTHLAVDVVITDMLMPGMNGLELLRHVRKQVKPVPVLLVSAHGSESLAAEAIRDGASSYVPKDQLASRLVETVRQVLVAARAEQSNDRLIESIADLRARFELENDPMLIAPLVGLLQQTAFRMNIVGRETRTRLGVALDEAMINAMYHGNLELPPAELADARVKLRNGEKADAIEKRRGVEPYKNRKLHVDVTLSAERLKIVVRDDGNGFSRFFAEDGDHRGLTVIKNILDEVSFNETGSEIRLVKYREEVRPDETLAFDDGGDSESSER